MGPHRATAERVCRFLAIAIAIAAILGASGTARAALEHPGYTAGDRWVYVLSGSLNTLPGLNASIGSFDLTLTGQVRVEVLGDAEANVSGTRTPAVSVATRTTAFLNGTFTFPGSPLPGSVSVKGTLTSNATELWEKVGYQTIESGGTALYGADLTLIVAVHSEVRTDFDTTTTITTQSVPFPLDVGKFSFATLDTNLAATTTISSFGPPFTVENRTSFTTAWRRTVLSQETITVEAGTFSAYKLNQTVGLFPGFGLGGLPVANETAYFSNTVGYYVKRVGYAAGAPVEEMRLKSYVYAAGSTASLVSPLTVGLIGGAAVVVALPLAWVFYRRKRRAQSPPPQPPQAPPPPPADERRPE